MQKNLAAHKKDEERYRRYLSTFKKTFPNFIYRSLDSSKPYNPTKEARKVEYIGATQEK
jgi:hypothetical protein